MYTYMLTWGVISGDADVNEYKEDFHFWLQSFEWLICHMGSLVTSQEVYRVRAIQTASVQFWGVSAGTETHTVGPTVNVSTF